MELFTVTQRERLTELNADQETLDKSFETAEERNTVFKELERALARESREKLKDLLDNRHVPAADVVAGKLQEWLLGDGYTKVTTPTIISKQMLEKMTIDEFHHLSEQVFWLDGKKCLRPMLAPNLYVVMRELKRVTNKPVKIYEIGSCFRKESQGAKHMNEFTMLNCVQLGVVKDGEQIDALKEMAHSAMKALGIDNYELVVEESVVYGSTMDIEVDGVEVASGSYGPHFLDAQWGVFDTWVGIGFGIERLAMVMNKSNTIKHFGRSISFIDGQPLNL